MNDNLKSPNRYYFIVPESLFQTELTGTEINILAKLYQMKKALEEVFPSNAHIANVFDLTPRQVRNVISRLSQLNYISYKVLKSNKRYIVLTKKALSHFEPNQPIIPQKEVLSEFFKLWD